jgi:hypothetical protein
MAVLEQIAKLIPAEWLEPAATDSPARCVAKIREQLALGCDGVILHGASPTDLEPIVRVYAETRPAAGFEHQCANPALS